VEEIPRLTIDGNLWPPNAFRHFSKRYLNKVLIL
jgi:hypothetical protein